MRGGDGTKILREDIVQLTGGWGVEQADVFRDKTWSHIMLSPDTDMVGVGLQLGLWLGVVIVGC